MTADIGTCYPLHCAALGKAILSHLPVEKIDSLLGLGPYEQMTENTITDRQQLLVEREKVRKCGYAVDREERAIEYAAWVLPP